MTARQRIEQLTNTWYGFTVFAALAAVLEAALWPFAPGLLFSPVKLLLAFVGSGVAVLFAILLNVVGAVIGLAIVTFLGRTLLARSAAMRLALVVASPIFAVFAALSSIKQLWTGVSQFSPAPLLAGVVSAIAVTLYLRSFRVLTDPAVKGYTGAAA